MRFRRNLPLSASSPLLATSYERCDFGEIADSRPVLRTGYVLRAMRFRRNRRQSASSPLLATYEERSDFGEIADILAGSGKRVLLLLRIVFLLLSHSTILLRPILLLLLVSVLKTILLRIR